MSNPTPTPPRRSVAPKLAPAAQKMLDRLRVELSSSLNHVIDAFETWDSDGDGEASASEFCEALSRVMFRRFVASDLPTDTSEADALIEALIHGRPAAGHDQLANAYRAFREATAALFDEYDADGGGTVAYREYVAISLRDALARSQARVIDLFRSLSSKAKDVVPDPDRFDKQAKPPPPGIEREDFHSGIASLGFAVRTDEMNALFDAWDADGSGRIELDELNRQLGQDSVAVSSLRRALRSHPRGKVGSGRKGQV